MNTKQKIQNFIVSESCEWDVLEAEIVRDWIYPALQGKDDDEKYEQVLGWISELAEKKKISKKELIRTKIFPWAQQRDLRRLKNRYGENVDLGGFGEFTKTLLTEKI